MGKAIRGRKMTEFLRIMIENTTYVVLNSGEKTTQSQIKRKYVTSLLETAEDRKDSNL